MAGRYWSSYHNAIVNGSLRVTPGKQMLQWNCLLVKQLNTRRCGEFDSFLSLRGVKQSGELLCNRPEINN